MTTKKHTTVALSDSDQPKDYRGMLVLIFTLPFLSVVVGGLMWVLAASSADLNQPVEPSTPLSKTSWQENP